MSIATLSDKVKFIESVFGSGKLARNEKNIDVRCPICAPRDASKKKLAILIEDDRNHCWTCGFRARSLVPLLRKFSTQEKLREYVDRFMQGSERSKKNALLAQQDVERKIELPKDFRLLALPTSDPDFMAIRHYLFVDRGLTEHDLWYYRIGASNEIRWKRRAIIPSFDSNGELNYFVARAIDKRKMPKYDNPDVDKLPIIFNEMNVDWKQRLVICEGALDLVKCVENTVPLLGSDLNEESTLFNKILINNTPIAVALDADMWETKTLKIAKKLFEYNIDVTIVDTREFGDPGSATKEQFKEAFDNAVQFDWFNSFRNKLNRASRTSLSTRTRRVVVV